MAGPAPISPSLSRYGTAVLTEMRAPEHSGQSGPGRLARVPTVPTGTGVPTASSAGPSPDGVRRLVPVPASSVRARRVRWTWDRRIVLGGLTLLAGREGLGKSTLACDLAAQLTRGTLVGEHEGDPKHVIYVSTEDSREYTVVPRLQAAGADLDRVLLLDAVGVDGAPTVLDLSLDLDLLGSMIREYDVAMVVLDAATSVLDHKLNGDRDREMRRGLEPIARLANDTNASVLGLVHFGKRESNDTGKLILGSVAWSQVARSVLAVAADDNGDLVVSPTKANLAPTDTGGLALSIVSESVETDDGRTQVGRVEWHGETTRDVRDLLGGEDTEEQNDVEASLRDYVTDGGGAVESKDAVKAACAEFDVSPKTVRRARTRAGIGSDRIGFPARTVWTYDPVKPSGDSRDTPTHVTRLGSTAHPDPNGADRG